VDVDRLTRQLGHPGQSLAALYVVTGDDPLLTIEAADALRAAARKAGYTERTSLVMDARSDWTQLGRATGSGSLFGDRQLLEVSIPTGKPGKQGADALIALAGQHGGQHDADVLNIISLPRLIVPPARANGRSVCFRRQRCLTCRISSALNYRPGLANDWPGRISKLTMRHLSGWQTRWKATCSLLTKRSSSLVCFMSLDCYRWSRSAKPS